MRETIDSFIKTKKIAILGASRDKKKWGNMLMKEFQKKGFEVFPVNPAAEEINSVKCYKSIAELPAELENLLIALPKEKVFDAIQDLGSTAIKRVWFQKGGGPGSGSPEAIEFCRNKNVEVIYGLCPMMYLVGGPHKIHLFFLKLFGKAPKELKG